MPDLPFKDVLVRITGPMHSVRLHQLASGVGEGRDAEGGAWRLGYERRGDLWVTWALAE